MTNTPSPEGKKINFTLLRLQPTEQLVAKKDYSIIPIRNPRRHEWFQSRPGDDWKAILALHIDAEQVAYAVDPSFHNILIGRGLIKRYKVYTLLTYGTEVLFLSLIGLANAGETENSYNRSRTEAYRVAETEWVQIGASKAIGGYEMFRPESAMAEPVWPNPPASLDDMLQIAFKGRYIDRADHPILNQIRGKL
jgi:hypothetical protein